MGYPSDILSTRAVICRGDYAIIPPEGLVNNVVPGIEDCRVSILATPKLGASFVMYIVTAQPRTGGTSRPFAAEDGVEAFAYIIDGQGTLAVGDDERAATVGAYAFAPAGSGLRFMNTGDGPMRLLLYKQRYIPVAGHDAEVVFGNVNDIEYRDYDDMANVHVKDLLPTHIGFDMNFHILSFDPGGCHPFFETHVQEHGMYILEGEGAYFFGNDEWKLIKKDDFVWFGAYSLQGAYGVGRVPFTYIYSKDCNRDVGI